MGNNSPSRYRREGKNAFEPYCDHLDFCPYNGKSFWSESNKSHWLDGWYIAKKEWKAEEKAKQEFGILYKIRKRQTPSITKSELLIRLRHNHQTLSQEYPALYAFLHRMKHLI